MDLLVRCALYDGVMNSPFYNRFITIGGQDCSNPGPIEGIHYFNGAIDMDAPMQGKCVGRSVCPNWVHTEINTIYFLSHLWHKDISISVILMITS